MNQGLENNATVEQLKHKFDDQESTEKSFVE